MNKSKIVDGELVFVIEKLDVGNGIIVDIESQVEIPDGYTLVETAYLAEIIRECCELRCKTKESESNDKAVDYVNYYATDLTSEIRKIYHRY